MGKLSIMGWVEQDVAYWRLAGGGTTLIYVAIGVTPHGHLTTCAMRMLLGSVLIDHRRTRFLQVILRTAEVVTSQCHSATGPAKSGTTITVQCLQCFHCYFPAQTGPPHALITDVPARQKVHVV